MRVRALVGVGMSLLLAAPSATIAAHASSPRDLVVRANHTSSGTLVVTTSITLPWYDAQTPPVPAGVIRTSGKYAAFVIYRGKQLVYGFASDSDIGSAVTWGDSNTTLQPGSYRVVAVTQRPVVFSMPLSKASRGFSVTTSKTTKAQRFYLNANTSSLSQTGSASLPLRMTADMAVMTAYTVDATTSIANESALCLSRKSGSCARGDVVEGSSGGFSVGPGDQYFGMTLFFYPYTPYSVAPGSYYLVGNETDVGIGERARLVTYTFG
jgi:hypothetical protein